MIGNRPHSQERKPSDTIGRPVPLSGLMRLIMAHNFSEDVDDEGSHNI
jgi:hypothetical protein